MLRSLHIENYRGLKDLQVDDLGRVNLFVGANNSGKTSLLEALHFVTSGGQIGALLASARRRGELSFGLPFDAPGSRNSGDLVDARFLFHGRELEDGRLNFVSQTHTGSEVGIEVAAKREVHPDDISGLLAQLLRQLSGESGPSPAPRVPSLQDASRSEFSLTVTLGGRVVSRAWADGAGAVREGDVDVSETGTDARTAQFLETSLLSHAQLSRLLDRALLENEETQVIEALGVIEPGITRVAAIESGARSSGRSIVVGVRDSKQLIPLGNLGEGMSRLLSVALAMVSAKDGTLIIDEIDTGLHHTVMAKMWRLIFETAKRLNVVVHASTHSYDCVHALATIATEDAEPFDRVTLTRVERAPARAVHFSAEEIRRLAEREIEAR